MTHDEIIDIINAEIEDRECACYDTTEEIEELERIKSDINNNIELNYSDYTWIFDLIEQKHLD